MQQFSIKQVEQLSGIKAHTLRIWEKRYKLIIPARSDGNQRTYSNEDLRSILRVVHLYQKGQKISKIANLNEREIIKAVSASLYEETAGERLMPLLLEACINLDAERVEEIFDEVERNIGFESMMLELMYPFLEVVGRAWMGATVFPVNEHFVSHLVAKKIINRTENLNRKKKIDKIVLLFQPAQEYHEIPLLFINYLLLKKGCATIYFGSNVALEELQFYCDRKRVTHIWYHLLTNLGDSNSQELLDKLSTIFSGKKIIHSGPCGKKLLAKTDNVEILKSQEELLAFIDLL